MNTEECDSDGEGVGTSESDASSSHNSLATSADSGVNELQNKSRSARVLALAMRVHAKLCIASTAVLAVKAHRQAVNSMLQLRDLLAAIDESAEQEVRVLLLTAGVAVQRRVALSVVDGEEHSDLNVTLALLFMLQVLCDKAMRGASAVPSDTGSGEAMDVEDAHAPNAPPVFVSEQPPDDIQLWNDTALGGSVMTEHDNEHDKRPVLRLTPEIVSRAALAQGPLLGDSATLSRLTTLATTFFRSSALAMQYSLLQGSSPEREDARSFLTLGTVDFLNQADDDMREKRLAAIVDAAESEAGQQVRSPSPPPCLTPP